MERQDSKRKGAFAVLDWIKIRGGLISSPKLIAMSRKLHTFEEFRNWLTPGGGGFMNGQLVGDYALRCVTTSLLCVTWSWSRQFGKEQPNSDCLLTHIEIDDIDGIAGAPGVGAAMEHVGWAVECPEGRGVILPNFFTDMNIPPTTNAERQKAYRERKRREERENDRETVTKSVTTPLRNARDNRVTRGEESISLPNPNVIGGGISDPPAIDWDTAIERANWLSHELPTQEADRVSLAKVAALMQTTLGDEQVTTAVTRSRGKSKPISYFLDCLKRYAEEGGWDFDVTWKAIKVPSNVLGEIETGRLRRVAT